MLLDLDAKHLDYPDNFVKIDFQTTTLELEKRISAHKIAFSLEDTNRFQKTTFREKGALIYFERATNRYWHLDTLHTFVEIEVYDRDGNHIGTAN